MNPDILRAILRHDWGKRPLRLLLACFEDEGPSRVVDWAIRSGLPRTKVIETARKLQLHRGVQSTPNVCAKDFLEDRIGPEGLVLKPQPPEFWDPGLMLTTPRDSERAWQKLGGGQGRLDMVTEAPTLADAMRAALDSSVVPNRDNPVVPNRDNPPPPDDGGVGGASIDRSIDRVLEKSCTHSRSPREPDRSIEGIEKENLFSRIKDRGDARPEPEASRDRTWLLAKLARIPQLEAEVLRPTNEYQQRIHRIFWHIEQRDPEWLNGIIGDLADRHDLANKASWFNKAATNWLALAQPKKAKRTDQVTQPDQQP